MRYYYNYDFPVGKIWIGEEGGSLTDLHFGKPKKKDVEGAAEKETPALKKAAKQLTEYFAGKRTEFDLPLTLEGTPFQMKVWKALRNIPHGKTKSYGEVAKKIKHDKAARAVGGANHRNPIAIIVPCHRVVGADGSLTGFGGGLKNKQLLLDLEQKVSAKPAKPAKPAKQAKPARPAKHAKKK
jgi:methylated-DNA-[protein]-cysteine S-methyltransferase